jgi:hypothetical protein
VDVEADGIRFPVAASDQQPDVGFHLPGVRDLRFQVSAARVGFATDLVRLVKFQNFRWRTP